MANLPEAPSYEAGIYQIETTDPVVGGVNGVSNRQARHLANRTAWLKQVADELLAVKGKSAPAYTDARAWAAGEVVSRAGNLWRADIDIEEGVVFNPDHWTQLVRDASTSAPGVVRLSSALDSDQEDRAATPAAIKALAAHFADMQSSSLEVAQWLGKAVGEVFFLRDDLEGVEAPPTDHAGFRFIRLTAGDAYNDGVLADESVSGEAPYITATAVVELADSPLDGETIELINTERRFIRAGASGTLQDDEFKSHSHELRGNDMDTVENQKWAPGLYKDDAENQLETDPETIQPTGGDETRPRNIGATAYMRIL